MTYLEYSSKKFKIINSYTINTSSRQVTFTDINIDFTNRTLEDLPIKYQEVQIKKDNTVIYTGYVNSFTLPSMKQSDNEFRELEINLLSPMQMATNKVVTIIGTYKLEEVIRRALSPLLLDGFEIKELNVRDGQKTVNFLMQTTEFVMNSLSNTESLWWYIDENKQIYINSIDYQFGLLPKMTLTHNEKVEGLLSITPSVEAVNYANVINAKNARVYFHSRFVNKREDLTHKPLFDARTIKKGETIEFKYPVDISLDTMKRIIENRKKKSNYSTIITNEVYNILSIETSKSKASITLDENNNYSISQDFSFGEEEKKMFDLKRDDFFKNLITGVTYYGDDEVTLIRLESYTALEYRSMKFVNSQEIKINKGKITISGIIERTVDMNERWFIEDDLITEIKSLMFNNSNQTNILTLEFDKDKNLNIGDVIKVNLPNFLTVGDYIITDINYTHTNVDNWKIALRSAAILENYIDLFREKEKQEINEQLETVTISEYLEENINEKYEVVENG